MRFSKLISTAALLGATAFAVEEEKRVNFQHQHNDKRAVMYVTNYHTTTVWAGVPPAAPSPPDAGASPAPENNETPKAEKVVSPSPLAASDFGVGVGGNVDASPESPSSSPSPSPSPSPSSSSPSGDFQHSAGNAKGITYSPYSADGTCKSASQIASDVASLSEFPIIRLYGVDCSQVENVLKAKASTQKLFLGIFYVDQIEAGVKTIKEAVEAHGSWDDIDTVSIGNELVNNGAATVSQIAEYMKTARSALSAAGYHGSVVSVDTFIAVINNPGLCELSDYMAVNAHAYFDVNTAAIGAGAWLLQQIQRVWTTCKGKKDILISETGWPSQGQPLGKAIPSKLNQKIAIDSIKATCGNSVILFTAFDDYWKADGSYGVEKFWGIV